MHDVKTSLLLHDKPKVCEFKISVKYENGMCSFLSAESDQALYCRNNI